MKYPFEISPGTVTDETVYSSPGVWSDSNNGRYRYGKPEPIGGVSEVWLLLGETARPRPVLLLGNFAALFCRNL